MEFCSGTDVGGGQNISVRFLKKKTPSFEGTAAAKSGRDHHVEVSSQAVVTVRCPLLVGADGIWSAVRRQKLTGAPALSSPTPPWANLMSERACADGTFTTSCGGSDNDHPRYLGVMVVLGRSSVDHELTDCSFEG